MLEREDILKLLPHRPPFLFVDRIIEFEPNKRIVATKRLSSDEYFFEGHFPGHPIMPGVLIIEALAQTAGVLAFLSNPDRQGKEQCYFMSVDKAKFRRPVYPGDELALKVELLRRRDPNWKCKGRAFVSGQLVAEAEMLTRLSPRESAPPAEPSR
ncbi:MAG: 3-hydroxyacyl-ACP dehydratase FabZ [Vicinamibacteria bacterium]